MKMKKYIFGMAFAVATLFTACDQDNEAAIYSLPSNGGVVGQCIAFSTNNMGNVEVNPNDANFKVPIMRGNSKGDFTGKVNKVLAIVDKDTVDYASICTIGDFTFKDGECTTEFNIDVEPLPVGKVLTLTMEYTDSLNLSPTSDSGTNVITVSVNKKYVWVSAGTCTFTDFTFAEGDEGTTAEGVVIEHAEATNRYRIIKPWMACYGEGGDGFTSDSGLQFTLSDDGDIDLVAGSGSVVASADQYDFCWVANYVGTYCIKEREGNTYYFSMLGLIDGDGYYTGFAFQFTWNR